MDGQVVVPLKRTYFWAAVAQRFDVRAFGFRFVSVCLARALLQPAPLLRVVGHGANSCSAMA